MQPSKPPSVAVIVPAWNQAAYLPAAVESVRSQSEEAFELVVVDDGSMDGTQAVVRTLAESDPRISCLRVPNGGPGAARNRGLSATTAPYVCFLDADDLLPAGKLAAQARHLDAHPDVDVVYSGAERFFDDDFATAEPIDVNTDGPSLVRSLLAGADRAFPLHAAMTRRSVLDRIGGFREIRPLVEDVDLWVRAACEGARFEYLEGEPVLYRKVRGTRSTLTIEVHEGYLPVHEWLARRRGSLPPELAEQVRKKARYRILALAGRRAADGRYRETRSLCLRSLRLGGSPGEWLESLRLCLFPRQAADLAIDAPPEGSVPPRRNSLADPESDR